MEIDERPQSPSFLSDAQSVSGDASQLKLAPQSDTSQLVASIYSHCQKHASPISIDDEISSNTQSPLSVFIQVQDGTLLHEPAHADPSIISLVTGLQLPATVAVRSEAVDDLISRLSPFQQDFALWAGGPAVPVLRSLNSVLSGESYLAQDAYMCVFKQERLMLLWSDSYTSLIGHVDDVLSTRIPRLLWDHAMNGAMQSSPTLGALQRPMMTMNARSTSSFHLPSALPSVLGSTYQSQHHSAVASATPSVHRLIPSVSRSAAQTPRPTTPAEPVYTIGKPDEFNMSSEMKEKYAIITRAIEMEERGPSDFDPEKGTIAKRP